MSAGTADSGSRVATYSKATAGIVREPSGARTVGTQAIPEQNTTRMTNTTIPTATFVCPACEVEGELADHPEAYGDEKAMYYCKDADCAVELYRGSVTGGNEDA